MGNYCVYILVSQNGDRTYVGQTNDLAQRLRTHRGGHVASTRRYRPWELLHTETCLTRAEAMVRERWYKTRQGRQKIAELLVLRRLGR